MVRMVWRLRFSAVITVVISLRISVMSADSIATSVPLPMAMPTSACTRAGASLMPSPTIATILPSDCNLRTTATLSWGSTSASTRSTPSSRAIAWAVWALSPVSITTSRPMRCSVATPSLDVGFRVSATAMTPNDVPSEARNMGVLPCPASSSARSFSPFSSMSLTCISDRLPKCTVFPLICTWTPMPGMAWNSDVVSSCSSRAWASRTMASPNGCSEPRSADAARRSRSFSVAASVFPAAMTSVTTGRPVVSVPVLSSTTVSTLWAISRA